MITDVYRHILDEDRKINTQRFDETFYKDDILSKENSESIPNTIDVDLLVGEISKNPELLNQLLDALKA